MGLLEVFEVLSSIVGVHYTSQRDVVGFFLTNFNCSRTVASLDLD